MYLILQYFYIAIFFEYSYRIPSNKREIEMKKNNSLLVLGIVSISLLFLLSVIQSSTAQRQDDDDKDHDKDKWNRHDIMMMTTSTVMILN